MEKLWKLINGSVILVKSLDKVIGFCWLEIMQFSDKGYIHNKLRENVTMGLKT